ncbi:MAG: hypothetical protein ABJC12_08715 [Saprospiraceae bacterium]
MKRMFSLLVSSLMLIQFVTGQMDGKDPLVERISYNADVMVNTVENQHRMHAYDVFQASIDSLLARKDSYNANLDSIKWLSIVHGDGFRIVTWQLRVTEDEFRYGGFIQWPDRVVQLKDNRPWVNGAAFNTYSPSAWYGCLYYKIVPFQSDGKKYYVLFGFNAEDHVRNTKVADILDLNGSEPKFGVPLFVGKDKDQSRLILTYGDVSPMQLLYDESLKAIVHDHLENVPGIGPSGESLEVSDGSMEGWFLKDGKWKYQEKVYDVIMNEPPMMEGRKDHREDKDLFGRPKKP